MPGRADELAKLTVLDEAGATVEVGTLWRARPAVLVFLRRFGWIHCREHVVQLHRKRDLFATAGADLVMIGNGSPSFIAGFRDETGWDGPLYTDPSLAVYRAAELGRGVRKTFNPRALGKTIKALAAGQRQGRTQGDPWQQSGVLVVTPDGVIRWRHASAHPGDQASAEEIVAALED